MSDLNSISEYLRTLADVAKQVATAENELRFFELRMMGEPEHVRDAVLSSMPELRYSLESCLASVRGLEAASKEAPK